MQILMTYVTPSQEQLENISNIAESYNGTDYEIPAISIQYKNKVEQHFYDIFWLRDHYMDPHKTEDIEQILLLRAVVLTKPEFDRLFS